MEMDMPKKNPSSPQHRVDIKHVHELNERTKELQCFQGSFMEEEVFLLEAIAKLIGQVLQRNTLRILHLWENYLTPSA